MNKLIRAAFIVLICMTVLVGKVLAEDATQSATPTNSPNACNGTCGSDTNCQSGLVCFKVNGETSGFCRNPSCQSQTSCNCPTTTATPTSTPSATRTPTSSPTARPTVTPTFTPTPEPTVTPEETETPLPSESPIASGGGTNIKGIAIGSLVVGVLLLMGGFVYLKIKNKNRVPPIGVFGS